MQDLGGDYHVIVSIEPLLLRSLLDVQRFIFNTDAFRKLALGFSEERVSDISEAVVLVALELRASF